MEERKLSEKESLEIISQMIQNTKERMENGTGSTMLMMGYLTVAVSIAVYVGILLTRDMHWNFLWLAILFIGYPVALLMDKKKKRRLNYHKTQIDSAISAVWSVMGACMLFATFFYCWKSYAVVLMPIALILIGIGSTITFSILKMKKIASLCALGIALGMGILGDSLQHGCLNINSILFFALGFVLITIIPGHYINYKARKKC